MKEKKGSKVVKQWVTTSGYEAEVVFNNWCGGFHCGYIIIDKNHPCFGVRGYDIEDCYDGIEVHGGLTFADYCGGDKSKWQVGFDCNHCWDAPKNREDDAGFPEPAATFKDEKYVADECESLAKQLFDIQERNEYIITINNKKKMKISGENYQILCDMNLEEIK